MLTLCVVSSSGSRIVRWASFPLLGDRFRRARPSSSDYCLPVGKDIAIFELSYYDSGESSFTLFDKTGYGM